MSQFAGENIKDLVGLLPLGMLFLDASGDCIYANPAFERLAGVGAGQAQGKGWMQHMAQEGQKAIANLLTGKVTEVEFVYSSRMVRARLTPTQTDKGLYCCTAEKITKPADLGERQRLMQQMLDCTDAILYSVDLKGMITSFNHAASLSIQLRKGVAIRTGDYWPDIISGDSGLDKGKMKILLKYVLSGNSYKTTEDLLSGNGETIAYSVQASPIFDEERQITGAVLCAQNITVERRLQREAAEKALIRTQELEHWNQFYDMLLSVMAHDLRQPLAAVILSADLVTHAQKKLSSEGFEGIMGNLRITSKKSIELLEGLLHWVRSKKQDFSYKPVPLDLYGLLTEANALFLYDQNRRGIFLDNNVRKGQVVYAHQHMILFVFRNLISNATKYAFDNSIIQISAEVTDGELMIAVRDSGKGMTAEQLAGLFTFRKNRITSGGDVKGAGMALTIAHDMIGKMNGRIWAESELDRGTTFYLTLPNKVFLA